MFENRAIGLALFLLPVGILLSEAFRSETGWSAWAYVEFFSAPRNQTVFFRTLKLGALVPAA